MDARKLAPPDRVYYFGCGDDSGHYAWAADGVRCSRRDIDEFCRFYDARLPPVNGREQEEGAACVVNFRSFAALAFWDRSVDTRPNSNSLFLVPAAMHEGRYSLYDMTEFCRAAFPDVWKRFKFKLVLKWSSDLGWRQHCPSCNTDRDTTCSVCGCGSCLKCRHRFCCYGDAAYVGSLPARNLSSDAALHVR